MNYSMLLRCLGYAEALFVSYADCVCFVVLLSRFGFQMFTCFLSYVCMAFLIFK